MSSNAALATTTAIALNQKNLNALAETGQFASWPQYDRAKVKPGIVHLGIGGFHRAHQAVYTEEVLAGGNTEWGICGVGLLEQDKDMCTILQHQDGLYTLVERNDAEQAVRIIGSMIKVIWGHQNPQDVLTQIASADTKVVSLTVTEKGYCFDNKGELDFTNPRIQQDVANIDKPASAIGYIVSGLKLRAAQNGSGLTVQSCDNLPHNGDKTKKAVLSLAKKVDASLATWIEANVSFPNSMVDRITPVTTPDFKAYVQNELNVGDDWPVVCESFRQWVIEDNFKAGRPAWETKGAQFVTDVEPYELMKVRLLNGSHSALSYPAYLAEHRDVDLAMADPAVKNFVRAYMDQCVTATLREVPGINLDEYKQTLIQRFSNTAIKDKLLRLMEDGSQKIPNAIVPCLAWQLQNNAGGKGLDYGAFALAAWFAYIEQADDAKDPLFATLKPACATGDATNVLAIKEIFGALPQQTELTNKINTYWAKIKTDGAKKTLQNL